MVKALADKGTQDKFIASGAELVPPELQTSKGFGEYIARNSRTRRRRRRSQGSSRSRTPLLLFDAGGLAHLAPLGVLGRHELARTPPASSSSPSRRP